MNLKNWNLFSLMEITLAAAAIFFHNLVYQRLGVEIYTILGFSLSSGGSTLIWKLRTAIQLAIS